MLNVKSWAQGKVLKRTDANRYSEDADLVALAGATDDPLESCISFGL